MEAKKGAATVSLISPAVMNAVKITASAVAAAPPFIAGITQMITGSESVDNLKTEGL
jgi:hypothetical protein